MSSGLAKRASATVTSRPPSASRSAAPSALLHAGAVADDRDLLALAQELARADLERPRRARAAARRPPRRAGSAAPTGPSSWRSAVWSMWTSIASSRGAISVDVRQAAQVGDVERAVVRRAVVADEAGAVHREHDGQLLQADVVDDLVVRALQERRVDRGHRARALRARGRPRTAAPAARRCRRRSSARASPSGAGSGPCRSSSPP